MGTDGDGRTDLASKTVDALADAVVTVDTTGVVTSWNPAAEALLGHLSAEMVGATLAVVVPEEFRSRHMSGFHAAIGSGGLQHGGRPAHVQAMTASGSVIPLAMTLGLLEDSEGTVVGVVAALRQLADLETFS